MSVILKHKDAITRVAIDCDVCSKEITDAGNGCYVWYECIGSKRSLPSFAHRGECAQKLVNYFHSYKTNGLVMDMPLETFMVYLANNLSLDWEHATERARVFSLL